MNYGLYLSASGVLTNMYRQDVYANNLANASTTGFKRDIALLQPRQPEAVEGAHSFDLSNELLDKLGGGVLAGPQRVSLGSSSFEKTGGPLDVALSDPETFFAVKREGSTIPALTRDGRFEVSSSGRLVTAAGGYEILDVNDRPIDLQPGVPVQINNDGEVIQAGRRTSLQITGIRNAEKLIKLGGNLMGFEGGGDLRKEAVSPGLKVGFIEDSSVNPIKALLQLVSVTKAITSNGNMIRYHDELMNKAVNVLGRVN